jgi:hypothetical protein
MSIVEQSETELTEGNVTQWTTFASDGATATVSNDRSYVKVGNHSLKFITQSGSDTGIRYSVLGDPHRDISRKNYLTF